MKEYKFDAVKTKDEVVLWIREFFEENGRDCNAVIGISGGKASSIAAALCVEALGKDRVIGVMMPNGEQTDIEAGRMLVNHLGIRNIEVNIKDAVDGVLNGIENSLQNGISVDISQQTRENLPPRIRMSTLYAISQSVNGRVVNTCNLSEDWVGYSTRYGDSVLNLPDVLVDKVPVDGLCGKSDEENLGFTYEMLDIYIRTGVIDDLEKKAIIDKKHAQNLFKLKLMPMFDSKIQTI